jgi:hypothetical protein
MAKIVGRKTYFNYPSGTEAMLIDCGDYEVEISKNVDINSGNAIKYTNKEYKIMVYSPPVFLIDWDSPELGGKIELKQRDRWGCEMIFIHYDPQSIVGMFDFIGKGYNIFETINKAIDKINKDINHDGN